MANNNTSNADEKEWKSFKLTPIRDEDGVNNYAEFRLKARYELDAAGYWKYIDGPEYKPPVIPDLKPTTTAEGLNSVGVMTKVTVVGNEKAVEAAIKSAETWTAGDKKAQAVLIRAVPAGKLWVVRKCLTAHDVWMALKNEYEPAGALTAVMIKEQILNNRCQPGDDPVLWRTSMIELHQALDEADPTAMPDAEFAKHLVHQMTSDAEWRFCRDQLRAEIRDAEAKGSPMTSTMVVNRLRAEEVEKGLVGSVVSVNALMAARRGRNSESSAVPSAYAGGPSAMGRRNDRVQARSERRPGPYKTAAPKQLNPNSAVCENTEQCESPFGHTKDNCFAYGGGKCGQYPDWYKGKRDVHLPLAERFAARRKKMVENGRGDSRAGGRFAGLADFTEDGDDEVEEAVGGGPTREFVFALSLPEMEDDDDVRSDEEVERR
uniref:Uncharacterized protein n=1 Tax=Mycena chlorophos TaxID=658473 RepID=A0ABQ0MB16_MYCCL|nr:predicted protein [Mycena chlorophos]